MASPTLPLPLRAGPEDSKQGSHQFPSGSCLDPGAQVFPEVNVLLQDRPPTSVLLVWVRVAEGTGTPEGGVRAWPMGPGGGSLGGHVGGLPPRPQGWGVSSHPLPAPSRLPHSGLWVRPPSVIPLHSPPPTPTPWVFMWPGCNLPAPMKLPKTPSPFNQKEVRTPLPDPRPQSSNHWSHVVAQVVHQSLGLLGMAGALK